MSENNKIPIYIHPFQAYSLAKGLNLKICTDMMCGDIGTERLRDKNPFNSVVEELLEKIPSGIKRFKDVELLEFHILQTEYPNSEWCLSIIESDDHWRSSQEYQLTLILEDKKSGFRHKWYVWHGWSFFELRDKKTRDAVIEEVQEARAYISEHSGIDNKMKEVPVLKEWPD